MSILKMNWTSFKGSDDSLICHVNRMYGTQSDRLWYATADVRSYSPLELITFWKMISIHWFHLNEPQPAVDTQAPNAHMYAMLWYMQ